MDEQPKHTNKELFIKQKELLDTFLAHNAITQAQRDFSLKCLEEKMNIQADNSTCK